MKKLLAILLATLMLAAFTACSNDEDDNPDAFDDYKDNTVVVTEWTNEDGDTFYFDSIDSETVTITGFASKDYQPHVVKIPAYLDGKMVIGIEKGSFANASAISKLLFATEADYQKDHVDFDLADLSFEIGDGAFRECVSITEVVIPSYISSLGEKAFYGCDALKTMSFADGCQLTELAYAVFGECESLESVTIPASVKSVQDAAFVNCKSLKTLTVSEGVESVGLQAFQDCEALESISLPVSLTEIGTYAFSGCSNIKTAKIPAWVVDDLEKANLETVEIIAGESLGNSAFKGCELLKNITLPASVTEIGDSAFLGCKSLEEIAIPAGVTKIGLSVFKNCTSLARVDIADHITSIGFAAFKGCVSLAEVKIPAAVESIDQQAFAACAALVKIEVATENTAYQTIDGSLYTKDGKVLMQYAAGKTDESFAVPSTVLTIDPCAFENCTALKTLTIPATVTSIGNAAFSGCASLANVTVPSWAIGFIPKTALQGIVINAGESIAANAFANSPVLVSVSIPASVTSIGKQAFGGCDALTTIIVDDANAAYKAINNVLYTKDGKTLIQYAAAKAETAFTVPAEVTAIEANAFANAATLTELIVPATVATIGNGAFDGCNALANVNIPASVIPMISKTELVSVVINSGEEIAESSFEGCEKLESVTFANTVTTIGANAFKDCALTALDIPASVTSIGDFAFQGNSLQTITVAAENTAYKATDNALYTADGTTLILYAAASMTSSVVIHDDTTTIAPYAFEGSVHLIGIWVKAALTEIGENAFLGCDHLYTVLNESALEIKVGSDDHGMIAANAVEVCTAVSDMKINIVNDFVVYSKPAAEEGGEASTVILLYIGEETSLDLSEADEIADNAFAGNATLITVAISKDLKKIGSGAFADCTAMTTIVFDGTKAEWEAIDKGDDWSLNMISYTIDCTDEDIVVAPTATPAE
ncbi:MAG: leucine-rich repeat protein [Clostridia bacterium]|nr:leucine-rich repeat protein [Clostridia bacterium]